MRGHSFLPADRVFGRVEKRLRKAVTVYTQQSYQELYAEFGNVLVLGKDWQLKNTKSLSSIFRNLTQLKEVKRIILKKHLSNKNVFITPQKFYKVDENGLASSLLKRGFSIKNTVNFDLQEQSLNHCIPQAKKDDVDSLLTDLFGSNWRTRLDIPGIDWYKKIIDSTEFNIDESNQEQHCECLDDDEYALHI